jgi:hypothetical protein
MELFKENNDVIYLNANIGYNYQTQNPGSLTPATYVEERTDAVLKNPSEYFMSIIKFSVPGYNIPILVFPNPASPNYNSLFYSVTIEYNGVFNQQQVVFQQRTNNLSELNYVYEYSHLLDMFNTALSTAFAAITTPVGSLAPYFIYDTTTELVSLICQIAYYDVTLVNPIKIYVNARGFKFFQSIPVFELTTNSPSGRDFQFYVTNLKNNFYNPPYLAPTVPPAYYAMTMQWNTLSNWNSFTNLVFTTGTIPIRYENVPAGNGFETQLSSDNFRPIITDFTPVLNNAGDQSSTFV